MNEISDAMTHDHRRCDEIFAAAEEAIDAGDWATGRSRFETFNSALERHFTMEERVLFPAFEERTGNTMGPTQVMRMDHEQMRGLLHEMAEAAAAENRDDYLGASETLLMMMQQHNIKEEQILYPMTDQVLAGEGAETLKRMEAAVEG